MISSAVVNIENILKAATKQRKERENKKERCKEKEDGRMDSRYGRVQGPGGREGSGKGAEQFKMADRLMTDEEQS